MSEPSLLTTSQKIEKFQQLINSKKRKLSLSNSTKLNLRVQRLSDKAKLPERISSNAHGYHLYSASNTVIPVNGETLVSTEIVIGLPEGTHVRVVTGNGLEIAVRNSNGCNVVNENCRGPIVVNLFNNSKVDFQVKEGDRIARLIIEQYFTPDVIEVEDLKEI